MVFLSGVWPVLGTSFKLSHAGWLEIKTNAPETRRTITERVRRHNEGNAPFCGREVAFFPARSRKRVRIATATPVRGNFGRKGARWCAIRAHIKNLKLKLKPLELKPYPNSYINVINGKSGFILCISLK